MDNEMRAPSAPCYAAAETSAGTVIAMEDKDKLRQVGEALFGLHWLMQMSAAIDVDERTLRRWAGGQPVPPGVWKDLAEVCATRAAALQEWATKLRN